MKQSPVIALTMGDPAGVGPEIIVKFFDAASCAFRSVVVGDANWLKCAGQRWTPELRIHPIESVDQAHFQTGQLDVLDLNNVSKDLPVGKPTAEGGKAAVEYIHRAVDLARNGDVDAITTAPINKEGIHLAGYPYPGHTELLAEYCGGSDVALMLAGGRLRVILATTHLALKDVRTALTQDHLTRLIRTAHRWLETHVTPNPKIALTGLNPHCGDGGIFGDEEENVILPALKTVRAEGIDAEGPFSADAFFPQARTGTHDAVITMYHDQGMIPVKMEAFGHAVNITLGLPIIRTSVDHGTAYDIAGKGIASYESLQNALETASQLAAPVSAHS